MFIPVINVTFCAYMTGISSMSHTSRIINHPVIFLLLQMSIGTILYTVSLE